MAFSGNSSEFPHRGGILALQGGFLFTGWFCLFTGRCLFIAPLKILTYGFKTRSERALKAAIRGRYEDIGEWVFPFCIAILRTRHRCLSEKSSGGPQFPAWGSPLLSSCDGLGFPNRPGIPGHPWEFPGIFGIPKATLQNREFPSPLVDDSFAVYQ